MLSDRCLSCLSVTVVHCGPTFGRIKMKLGTQVGLGPSHIVLDGDPAPTFPKGEWSLPAKFSAHVYCGQTAGWMKMPLGTKVGLSPGDSVLDGDPARSPQRGWSSLPNFGQFLLWPNGWMHQDVTWYGGKPEPGRLCVRWGPSPLPEKGRSPAHFSAHVWPNGCMDKDATWYGDS